MASELTLTDKQYRVSYKFHKTPTVNMNYTSRSLAALLYNLGVTEGVTTNNVEHLYVHQTLSNGQTLELVSIDRENPPKTNVIPFRSERKPLVVTGEYDDDDLLGWGTKEPEDETVLNTVTRLLTNISNEASSKALTITKPPTPRRLVKGFDFKAVPANRPITET